MRLIDRIVSTNNPYREHIRGCNPVSFVVDNVAADYYAGAQQEFCSKDDFPYCIPPWEFSFVEWVEPREIRLADGIRQSPYAGFLSQVGVLVRHVREGVSSIPGIPPGVASVAALLPINAVNGRVFEIRIAHTWFLSESGVIEKYVTSGDHAALIAERMGREEAQRQFNTMTHIVGLSFTFANCKNVRMVEADDLAPRPKIARRLGIPKFRRYTLQIGNVSTRSSSSGDPVQSGIIPYHLCRGHFATYTEEAPLFGKHVGRYWIPPHVKGKQERGVVVKDYAAGEVR